MVTGGRIKHHIANNIGRPESTILFVGYQAEGTLGRLLLEVDQEVRLFGEKHKVRSHVEKIEGFSSHADQQGLLHWLSDIRVPPHCVFVTHGGRKSGHQFRPRI